MSLVGQAATLVAFPVAASVVGAVVASIKPPGPRIVSGVQHFAAGVVLAALVGEIMPELRGHGHLSWVVIGFCAGAALVLGLGAYGRRTESRAEAAKAAYERSIAEAATAQATEVAGSGGIVGKGIIRGTAARVAAPVALPVGMLAAMVIDLLLDGVLVGLGAQLGFMQGVILTIALTLEILFLSLSVVAELTDGGLSTGRSIAVCTGLGLCTAVGAIGAALLLGGVDASVMTAVLAFGAAALLYLVVEELLVEAHEERETVALGAMFFLGFILIYTLASLEA